MKKRVDIGYHDYVYKLFFEPGLDLAPNESLTRNITFQVTDDCCMNCSYCYQGHKGHRIMSKEVARKGVDLLFDMYEKNDSPFINKKAKAIILDFIGGEPLMAVDVIDYICTYFVQKCLELDHPWLYTWRASMTSNGALYFEPAVQNFLKKFRGNVSFSITLDGPKEIHDACRVYHDGRGNFDDAYAAMKHFNSHYYEELGTKVTIAPENLHNLNKIVDFFLAEGMNLIHANCVYEAKWTYEQASVFYDELKKMADKLLERNDETTVSLFDEAFFRPLPPEENSNWCGGDMKMLAFDPAGIAYPCLRYMSSSLGTDRAPIIVGSVDGLFVTEEQKLEETSRARVLELVAGKRMASTVAAIINNFDIAEEVTGLNYSGSALKENEKYLESINGRIDVLKASYEELSQTVLDSGLVKALALVALILMHKLSKLKRRE